MHIHSIFLQMSSTQSWFNLWVWNSHKEWKQYVTIKKCLKMKLGIKWPNQY